MHFNPDLNGLEFFLFYSSVKAINLSIWTDMLTKKSLKNKLFSEFMFEKVADLKCVQSELKQI